MAPGKSYEVERFSRIALQRLEDARLLNERCGRGTAAVYLAGYAVECGLKALLLSSSPPQKHLEVVESFRGKNGHNFESLRARYERQGGPVPPRGIAKALAFVNLWTTDLRYHAGMTPPAEAGKFLEAVELIIDWTEGRLRNAATKSQDGTRRGRPGPA